jgi:hypothetical protein
MCNVTSHQPFLMDRFLYNAFTSGRVGVHRRNKMQATNEKSFSTASQSNDTNNLVEALPTREGWSSPLVLYKNCWIRSSMLPSAMSVQNNFKPRSTDVILATHPKCGTTWLKALAFAITNRSIYTFSDHPLHKENPQELVTIYRNQGRRC